MIYRITESPNHRIIESLNNRITESPNHRVLEIPNHRVTELTELTDDEGEDIEYTDDETESDISLHSSDEDFIDDSDVLCL